MTKVSCTVNSCTFWGTGNICRAEKILVTINAAAGVSDMEIGEIGETPAQVSQETCCHTFRPKDGGRK